MKEGKSKCKLFLSLLLFIKGGFLVMSWCTSVFLLQDLPFKDNMHLGSIPRFQPFPCVYICFQLIVRTLSEWKIKKS